MKIFKVKAGTTFYGVREGKSIEDKGSLEQFKTKEDHVFMVEDVMFDPIMALNGKVNNNEMDILGREGFIGFNLKGDFVEKDYGKWNTMVVDYNKVEVI